MTILERTVSGGPGIVAERDGMVVTVMASDMIDEPNRHLRGGTQPARAGTDGECQHIDTIKFLKDHYVQGLQMLISVNKSY